MSNKKQSSNASILYLKQIINTLCFLMLVNKSKVLYGIPRDPDVLAALAQLEKEEIEAAANEDEKPKVNNLHHS